MTEAQEQLQQALVTTYYANLLFLSRYDKKLYDRIENLSSLIDNGEYEERYALEFIQDQGEFDIYDTKHDKFLYDRNPQGFIKKAVASVNFDTKGSFTIFDEVLYKNDHSNLEYDDVVDHFDNASTYLLKDVSFYRNILDDNLSTYKEQKFKKIDKFMFIGTLLGRHIIKLAKKTEATNFFVCEHNLEIFRLSLFVFDYTLLVEDGRTVVFSIMDDDHEFKEALEKFLKNKPYLNYNLKYYTTDYNTGDFFDPILDGILGQKSTTFNHHMMLKNVARNAFERVNNYNVLQLLNIQEDDSILKKKPILYVGAGPSLVENIEWIKENQDRFIIVAMGASYKKLLEHDIVADVVTTLDPEFKILDEYHFDDESLKKIPNAIILASLNTNPKILKKFNKDNLFLYEIIFPIHSTNLIHHGYSIGEIIGTLLVQCGVKDLYLVGIDLAVNQETGETHMSGYETGEKKKLDNVKKSMDEGKFSLRGDLIEVKGNTRDTVLTTRLFSTSLGAFSHNLNDTIIEGQNIYNLSENGAYIDKTEYINPKDVDVDSLEKMDKTVLKDELIEYYKSISKDHLSERDKSSLEKEYRYLKKVKRDIQNDKKVVKNFEEFWDKNEEYFKKLYSPDSFMSLSSPVFSFFFNSVLPYVFYHFNQKKIKKEKAKIKAIEEIFHKQTIDLIDAYNGYLEKAIK